ncbi:hypothetical protein K456DRAFT_1332220 [Colletotrichum gloeosporioides 23]|nr:hypothetical protein K456DRAFT_1332220 [Colletotrichum gloeosporioides 23]KAJ0268028.1 hypothetical protein COL940_013787 [Colletotrichum noveboracense]
MNDHVIQADQDIQEPQSYNSVWQLDIEIDPPLASGLDPDDLEDDPKGPKRTFKYWLKIKDDFPLPQNETAVHKPTFVPLPFPFKRTNDPYKWGLLTLEDWNIYCQRTVSPSVPWSNTFRPKNSSLGDRTLRVRYGNLGVDTWDYNDKTPTKYNGSTTKYEGDNKDWAAFYDFLLEQGQNLSHINSDADIQENFDQIELQWNKPKVKDSRDYDVVKGFGFVPKRWGGQAAPKLLRDTRYVKLLGGASSAGRALIENDNGAQARGVRQHHIYLEESAINSLVSGNYDWPGSGYCVTTRTEEGGFQYIDCADSNLANSRRPGSTIGKSSLQKPQFWKKAMDSGLSVKAQRPLRSRNVGELDMVLVVQERAMPAVSKEQLEGVIKKAKLEAKIPIKENDCRVLTNKEKDASPGFTNKYLLVATSPFGH